MSDEIDLSLQKQRMILKARDRCHMDDTLPPSRYEVALVESCLSIVRDALIERAEFGDPAGSVLLSVRLWFDVGGKFEVEEEDPGPPTIDYVRNRGGSDDVEVGLTDDTTHIMSKRLLVALDPSAEANYPWLFYKGTE
jgi:hypothetical protein